MSRKPIKRLWLDTEFDEGTGSLLSLALVADTGEELYIANKSALESEALSDWVKANVVTVVESGNAPEYLTAKEFTGRLELFLGQWDRNHQLHLIADWPSDFGWLVDLLITGPGTMIDISGITMEVVRLDAYPNSNPKYIQHNALWDAHALRALMIEKEGDARALVYAERVFLHAADVAWDMDRVTLTVEQARTLHVRHTLRTLIDVAIHASVGQKEPFSPNAELLPPALPRDSTPETVYEFMRNTVQQLDAGWNWARIWSALSQEVDEFNELTMTEMFSGKPLESRTTKIPLRWDDETQKAELPESQKRMLESPLDYRLRSLHQYATRYGAAG